MSAGKVVMNKEYTNFVQRTLRSFADELEHDGYRYEFRVARLLRQIIDEVTELRDKIDQLPRVIKANQLTKSGYYLYRYPEDDDSTSDMGYVWYTPGCPLKIQTMGVISYAEDVGDDCEFYGPFIWPKE